MERKFYKAIDSSSSFFGIRGRFIILTAACLIFALMIAAVVGKSLGGMVGTVTAVAGGAASYMATRYVQSRMSEREFTRLLFSRGLPKALKVSPRSIKSHFR